MVQEFQIGGTRPKDGYKPGSYGPDEEGVAIRAILTKVIGLSKAPLVAIVDDDEAVREALSDLLLVLDLTCRTFDRAEAFMADYVPGRFDCLITDVMMPGRSGLDLLRHLRSIGSSIPVIVVTADTSPATRAHAMRIGAHAYLTKPISSEALYRRLQSAMKREGSRPDEDGPETPSDG
jgi:two-component system, LuxR family, response regulator FixJ